MQSTASLQLCSSRSVFCFFTMRMFSWLPSQLSKPCLILRCRDHQLRAIVLAVRGTHSFKDMFTSLTGELGSMVRPGQQSCSLLCPSTSTTLCVLPMLAGASKPHHLVDSNGVVLGFSHFGMLAAARWIKGQTRACLEEALAESPGGCARTGAACVGAWSLEPGLLGSSGACISPCDSHQPLSTRCHHLANPGVQATASSLLGALFWHLNVECCKCTSSKSWGSGMHVIVSLSCWCIVPFTCGLHFSFLPPGTAWGRVQLRCSQ